MRAHDKIDIVHAESACREVLLVAIGIHHVPKAPRRSRLMVAHAAIDHDGVVRCLHDVALNGEHQVIPGIEEPGLQPSSVLVEKLPRHGRKKLHRLEEWTLLLDDAVDRSAANFDLVGQDGPPSRRQSAMGLDRIAIALWNCLWSMILSESSLFWTISGSQLGMLQPFWQICLPRF